MSNGSTFVHLHCWTNNVRQFAPALGAQNYCRSKIVLNFKKCRHFENPRKLAVFGMIYVNKTQHICLVALQCCPIYIHKDMLEISLISMSRQENLVDLLLVQVIPDHGNHQKRQTLFGTASSSSLIDYNRIW